MKSVLSDKKAIAIFVLPGLLLFTAVVMVPVIWSFYYSFFSGSPGLNWKFVGFKNYKMLFTNKAFLASLIVSIRYIIYVMVGQVGLGLLLALFFKFWLKTGKNLVRTLVFFPVVIPTVAVGQLFAKIYEIQPYYGLLNGLLEGIGLDKFIQPWIGQSSTALPSLAIMDVWVAMGFYSVIFYGALLDIPEEVVEASKIDGCNAFNLFWHILLPLLRPISVTCLIFSFTGTVKMFESSLALTGGGPGSATTSLSMYMYDVAFTFGEVGFGSVIAIVVFLMCVIGSSLIRKLDVEYE